MNSRLHGNDGLEIPNTSRYLFSLTKPRNLTMTKEVKKKLKILIIDPNPLHQEVYKKISTQTKKYSFDFTEKPSEALKLLNAKYYQLILSENFFPSDNSHDWISNIRNNGHLQPLVIITHFKNDKLTLETLKNSVDDYHYKTNDTIEKLPSILETALSKSKHRKKNNKTISRLGTLDRITKNFRNLMDTVNRPAQAFYNQPATQKQLKSIEHEVEKFKSTLKNLLFD